MPKMPSAALSKEKQAQGLLGTAALPRTRADFLKLEKAAPKHQIPVSSRISSLNLRAGKLAGPMQRRVNVP